MRIYEVSTGELLQELPHPGSRSDHGVVAVAFEPSARPCARMAAGVLITAAMMMLAVSTVVGAAPVHAVDGAAATQRRWLAAKKIELIEAGSKYSEEGRVRVEEARALGRVLLATRSYAKGEVVWDENPVLTFADSPASLLESFVRATASVQEAVLDMFAGPPVPSAESARYLSSARMLLQLKGDTARLASAVVPEKLNRLLLVKRFNAFGAPFDPHGPAGGAAGAQVGWSGPSALFATMSKAAHSCDPNMINTIKVEATEDGGVGQGFMRFWAARDIEEGEILTVSYLSNLTAPRHERRARLVAGWEFECFCQRCAGEDDCRALKCEKLCDASSARCDGVMLIARENPELWQCRTCGAEGTQGMPPDAVASRIDIAPRMDVERQLAERLAVLEEEALQLQVGAATVGSAFVHRWRVWSDKVMALADEAAVELSSTHYLRVRGLRGLGVVASRYLAWLNALKSRPAGTSARKHRTGLSLHSPYTCQEPCVLGRSRELTAAAAWL